MDVRVVRDALVLTPDKEIQALPIQTILTDVLLLPQNYVKGLFRHSRVRIGRHPAQPYQVLTGQKLWLMGGVEALTTDENDANQRASEEDLLGSPHDRDSSLTMSSQSLPDNPVVIYEDSHLFVVNKPVGMLIHTDTAQAPSGRVHLDNWAWEYVCIQSGPMQLHHVHRLDKGTSGAVVYAKHDYCARALDAMLAKRQINRNYVAVVDGSLAGSGTFAGAIGRHRHVSGKYRVSTTGKAACTHYRSLHTFQLKNRVMTLVACTLDTGRTHQIRVHLSDAGHPILGDTLYGGGAPIDAVERNPGFYLHALAVNFVHPYTRELVRVKASLPRQWDILNEYMDLSETINTYYLSDAVSNRG